MIRLEARPANAELVGAITMTDLVRQSLRMRPDRVVIGEVRGPEISDLLMALNTGHEGGCGTVHANSAGDVPTRLEALGALGGLGRDVLHAQLAAALDTVVHITRKPDGRRWLSEICVLSRGPSGLVVAERRCGSILSTASWSALVAGGWNGCWIDDHLIADVRSARDLGGVTAGAIGLVVKSAFNVDR